MATLTSACGLLAISLTIAALPSQAEEYFTKAVGGKGGGPFVLHCPAGTLLTGLSSRQGAYINYIAPICNGEERNGSGTPGNKLDAACPAGTYIGNMSVLSLRSRNRLLKAVAVHCNRITDNYETEVIALKSPGEYTDYFKFNNNSSPYPITAISCGAGRSVGIQGRSGAAVDALGLICAR